MIVAPREEEIRHFHVFCGLGGGAKGFNRGRAQVGNVTARFRCIGGIDVDASAIRDFNRLAGAKGTVLDLFSRDQYRAFFGHEPPANWREVTSDDIRRAAGGERPHIVFSSPPCKGYSGLLSETQSKTRKYQALNELALRGIWLTLEAWKDDPPEFFLIENVPRIANRGRSILDQIVALLEHYGYATAETTHDCGELGGLGQSRKRFLLVARHRAKVPPFLYEPVKRRMVGVGDIIGRLPVPGPDLVLPMHRLPALQWKTWVRLAFVKAGSDWRSLNELRVSEGLLQDFALVPDVEWHRGSLGVRHWDDTSGCVTGRGNPTCGNFSVADPRPGYGHEYQQYGVREWRDTTGAVSGQSQVGGGSHAVADPRYQSFGNHSGKMRVEPFDTPVHTITGSDRVGSGAMSVADPRVSCQEGRSAYGVLNGSDPAPTIINVRSQGQGRYAIADPRIVGRTPFSHRFRIVAWDRTYGCVTGSNAGTAAAVADPRSQSGWTGKGKYTVSPYDGDPSGTVIGASTTGNGAFAVADPRPVYSRDGKDVYRTTGEYGVVPWQDTVGAVTATGQLDNGRWSVADPRAHLAGPLAELPAPNQRLVACIQALDGTYHRPFTTLELAFLQNLMDEDDVFAFDGTSDSSWREHIGNAVPPAAAEAMAGVFGTTLLLAWAGETFVLSATPVWVRPIAVALSVNQGDRT